MGGVDVSDAGNGALLLTTPWFARRFVEVEPLYFRQVDGPYGVVFQEDGQGRVDRMFTDFTPMMAFEKVAWYETLPFSLALIAACLVVFLSVIPAALVRFVRNRRRRSGDQPATPRQAHWAYRVLVAVSVLNLLFVTGTFLWGNPAPFFGVSAIYKVVLGLGVVAALLTIASLIYTVLAWTNRYWGTATRVHYTLVSVAALGFVWFLNNWNLLGWQY